MRWAIDSPGNRAHCNIAGALAFLFQFVRMPLVTNLDSDDEGLLELVDGQEIIRERSQTKLDALDDIDTDSNDEDRGLNRVGNGVPTSASKLGTVGKHFSAGASRRMSMGSVATHGSMPEEYSFDHVGLDGRHTTTMYQPVSVSTPYSTLKNGGPKVVCEMESLPQVDQKRRSSRNSDAGSKSSRDVSVASLGTAPSYHAGKGQTAWQVEAIQRQPMMSPSRRALLVQ